MKAVGELLVEVHLAGTSAHLNAPQPENRIIKVADLGLLEAKLHPRLPDGSKPPGALLSATVDHAIDGGRACGCPFDVIGQVAGGQALVVLIPGLDELANDLDVPLRHRLLPQRGGFEGLFTLLVHGDALDCPVADRECPGDPSLDLESIAPHRAHRPRNDYVLTDLDELVRVDLNGLPTFIDSRQSP